MNSLTVPVFEKMISETVKTIDEKKEYLNYVNVFPVRDGDTGNNLLFTLNPARRVVTGRKSLRILMKDLKKSLLLNARGNSGIIISQFYDGFCSYLINKKVISAQDFAKAISEGSRHAYKSVTNPVEGTILTVMKAASKGALEISNKTDSIIEVLNNSFSQAQESLKKTIKMLPILKSSGVVDAGGLGFVYMFGAWLKAIGVDPGYDSSLNNLKVREVRQEINKKYCVNILMENQGHGKELKRLLDTRDGSFEMISDNDLLRLHMHTNDYESVRQICSAFGKIKKFEFDNMKEQYENARKD